MATPVHISLVIPAHNEQDYLPRLLDTVDEARDRYLKGRDAVQVIVGDNASTDATADIARRRGCDVVHVAERKIACARNGGTTAAVGQILAFVDADAQIHPETFNAVDRAMASGRFVAGATGVRLERMSLGIAVTWGLMVPWVILLRMDTGVVFCSREDFDAIGGYDERRYFGEDVQFLVDLRRVGRTRGQRLTRLRPVKAIASTRKFDRLGDWHYFGLVGRLLWVMLRHPSKTTAYAQGYWYADDRQGMSR
jgi:glycosyltransferase involved in cell wall biosynthesis